MSSAEGRMCTKKPMAAGSAGRQRGGNAGRVKAKTQVSGARMVQERLIANSSSRKEVESWSEAVLYV